MERITESVVPTSDIVATTTMLDGFTLSQIDQLGGNTSHTREYSATGVTTTSTTPRATTYDYLSFGGVAATGSKKSPVQWSSEVYDEELALVYYNYRHYNPADGRWINRDPIGIKGGLNLYGFVGNRIWLWDALGRQGCYGYTYGGSYGGGQGSGSAGDNRNRKLCKLYFQPKESGSKIPPSINHPAGWYTGLIFEINNVIPGISDEILEIIKFGEGIIVKVKEQITKEITKLAENSSEYQGSGSVVDYFTNKSYPFLTLLFALGDGTVGTLTDYTYKWCKKKNDTKIEWNGETKIYYFDVFEDPLDLGIEIYRGIPYGYYHNYTEAEVLNYDSEASK